MPTISLTDQLGVEIDLALNDGSALSKYIKDLKKLRFSELKFTPLENLPLDQVPLKSLTTGITFEQSVGVGVEGTEMKIGAGVSGSFKLLSSKEKQLFDPDEFSDPIQIDANQLWIEMGIAAKLSAEVANQKGDLSFGFGAGTQIALNTYRLFEKDGAGVFPNSLKSLKETVAGFVIPGDLEDLEKMAKGTVATVEGNGSLKFSGSFDVLSVVNPLAVVNLPDPLGELNIKSGSAIKVGASVEITGAYQIRVQKLDDDKVGLGYYKRRGTEFGLKVSASSGLAVGVGKFDLIEILLKAISSNPADDLKELQKVGLNESQLEAIKKVLEAGVSRKLEIALGFELSSATTSEAAFLFELQLGKLDQAGRQAVHAALDGDLSGFGTNAEKLPVGVSLVRSIFTETQKEKHSLKFNLLGIYNFMRVSTLILKGRVMIEPATGELIIADTATATKIEASTHNFAAEGEKLRKVLAESVMLTVAYQSSKLVTHSAKLKVAHTYFELHTKTDRTALKNNLDVFEALDLMTKDEKAKILGIATQFGKTTLYAETGYTDEVADNLFLNNGAARSQEEYERAGRNALALLVQPGEKQDARWLPATDDNLWNEMSKQAINFQFIPQFAHLDSPTLKAIDRDYVVIKWWAKAMAEMSKSLVEMRHFLTNNPHLDQGNKTFISLRKKLASSLKDVASKTKEEFGDPWGLVAMDQVSGGKAAAKTLLMGAGLAILRER